MKLAAPALPAVRAADLVELTKPRITLMVVLTAAVAAVLAAPHHMPAVRFLHLLVGTALVAGAASTLNQVIEREYDARMRRTANRPLPAGRMQPDQALLFGVGTGVTGLLELLLGVNLLTAAIGAATLAGYVFVYTPLKRVSSLATVVGAIPGAMPPLMGWAAMRDQLEPGAWALFGLMFFWQLPHFLAIAWIYRADYERGGYPMLAVGDAAGERTARQALLYGVALVPVSLLPAALRLAAGVYLLGALALGLGLLACCVLFALSRSSASARRLMFASVLYLPALLLLLVLDRLPLA